MVKLSSVILLTFFIIVTGVTVSGQNNALDGGLFLPDEVDMHVHAGKERPLSLDQWLDLFVKDGRKVLLLLDHLELYRMTGEERKSWIKKNNVTDWYPDSLTARRDFMNDLAAVEKRNDILTFRGWEIWEGELDEGLEREPMRDAEVIGWHISRAAWNGKAPGGKELLIRARQITEVQKEFPVPMIIFHPFSGRIKAVIAEAERSGRSRASITKDEYRYFTREEQKEIIGLLAGRSVYIEIEREWFNLWDDLTVREAFIEDIRPLAESGIKFTVSTDAHGQESFAKPYNPGKYCSDLGIGPENINALIRELLAFRVKRDLK